MRSREKLSAEKNRQRSTKCCVKSNSAARKTELDEKLQRSSIPRIHRAFEIAINSRTEKKKKKEKNERKIRNSNTRQEKPKRLQKSDENSKNFNKAQFHEFIKHSRLQVTATNSRETTKLQNKTESKKCSPKQSFADYKTKTNTKLGL